MRGLGGVGQRDSHTRAKPLLTAALSLIWRSPSERARDPSSRPLLLRGRRGGPGGRAAAPLRHRRLPDGPDAGAGPLAPAAEGRAGPRGPRAVAALAPGAGSRPGDDQAGVAPAVPARQTGASAAAAGAGGARVGVH